MPKFKRYTFQNAAGDEGSAGGSASKPETFSREYVTELRSENATYRTKAREAEQKAIESEVAAKKFAEEAAAKAEAKAAERETAANDRIVRAELKAEAIKAGMVDLDGLKLADLSKVKLNDAGEVEGADELMKALKEAKPYLFGTTTTTSNPEKKPEKKDDSKPKTAKDMDEAEKKKLGLS
jgi:hypothetical protein